MSTFTSEENAEFYLEADEIKGVIFFLPKVMDSPEFYAPMSPPSEVFPGPFRKWPYWYSPAIYSLFLHPVFPSSEHVAHCNGLAYVRASLPLQCQLPEGRGPSCCVPCHSLYWNTTQWLAPGKCGPSVGWKKLLCSMTRRKPKNAQPKSCSLTRASGIGLSHCHIIIT